MYILKHRYLKYYGILTSCVMGSKSAVSEIDTDGRAIGLIHDRIWHLGHDIGEYKEPGH